MAAGVAAALAMDTEVAVQDVPYAALARKLDAQGATLVWGTDLPDVVLDVREPIPAHKVVNGVSRSTGWVYKDGKASAHHRNIYTDAGKSKGQAWMKFEQQLEPNTPYRALAWYLAGSGRASVYP